MGSVSPSGGKDWSHSDHSSAVRVELGPGDTGHDVVGWRRNQLVQSGFPPPLAVRLAIDPRFDLHALIELVERGCAAELAIRILSPLEAGEGMG